MIKVLDLGCGPEKRRYKAKNEHIIHLDFSKEVKPDVIHDLNKFPYPFKNNEFDKIIAFHILEHLNNIVNVMEELYRILKPNGLLFIRVPHCSSRLVFSNPTHQRGFAYDSFNFFDKNYYEHYGNCNFKTIKVELHWANPYQATKESLVSKIFNPIISEFANKHPFFCERFWCYYVGGFNEVYYEIKAIK